MEFLFKTPSTLTGRSDPPWDFWLKPAYRILEFACSQWIQRVFRIGIMCSGRRCRSTCAELCDYRTNGRAEDTDSCFLPPLRWRNESFLGLGWRQESLWQAWGRRAWEGSRMSWFFAWLLALDKLEKRNSGLISRCNGGRGLRWLSVCCLLMRNEVYQDEQYLMAVWSVCNWLVRTKQTPTIWDAWKFVVFGEGWKS
jgi:hypothetical protein